MIVCCGEALMDMLPRQLPCGEHVFLPVCGGAVFNTAIALGRLGAATGFVSGISTDMFGEQLMDSLSASRVDNTYCVRSELPTTLAFVRLVDGQARYTFMDENSAGRTLSVDNLPDLPAEVSALHFGAISLIPEPCGTAFETLMKRHHRDKVISLDPNIRPGFISDEASYRARLQRMIAMADIVKVSDEDLNWLAPGVDHALAIKNILRSGPAIVLLTKGAAGVDVFLHSQTFPVRAPRVDVVDTIGAGDTFNAGFLKGLEEGALLEKDQLRNAGRSELTPAVELAVRVAAVTVSRIGANPPWDYEINERFAPGA